MKSSRLFHCLCFALTLVTVIPACAASSTTPDGSGGNSLDDNCNTLCGKVSTAGCTTQSACMMNCEDTSTLPPSCLSLYGDLIQCGANEGSVGCKGTGESIGGCDLQAEAVNECVLASANDPGDSGPSPDTGSGPGSGTTAAGCQTSPHWQQLNVCAKSGRPSQFYYQCNASLMPSSCSEVTNNSMGVTCSTQAPCWCCPSGV